ncbi:erythromycin esterase family protein [Plantactinospora soyae]|uniref:Erythromycin esterase n=1 Tax=Plantactinospora soyae TaxID=1544732 RepID=A0A927R4J3_9ACTN|nr:erythromycin esterase family protein [Plantactinospora soyae]MBE1486584.1 erythromycin esterase [Plantactinospora soyae]
MVTRRSILTGLGGVAASVGAATLVPGRQPAYARAVVPAGGVRSAGGAVPSWIDRYAVPLSSIEPGAPLDDLAPLGRTVGDALVVGLGESVHGSHDQFTLKHRVLRYLVERRGFRTLALEEDFASGVALDRYVVSGAGDPAALVGVTSHIWRTEEMLTLVRWMRAYNLRHREKLRFLGTDITQLRALSFDEVTGFVRRVAPDRLAELEQHLGPIRPQGDPWEHMAWYFQQPDRQPYVDSARRAEELVAGLRGGSRLDRAYAQRHAAAVHGWYTFYADGQVRHRDLFMADTIGWWHRLGGGKAVYWAANAHTAATPTVTFTLPPVTRTEVMAGSLLRQRYGRCYVSIGTVFHQGEIFTGWTAPSGPSPHRVGRPAPGTVDEILGGARLADYLLDLRSPASGPVDAWLRAPGTIRLIGHEYDAANDPAHNMVVDPLAGAFDAILHLGTTTPTRPLR